MIDTRHLHLRPLTLEQLQMLHADPARLEKALGWPISRDMLAHPVPRAISMKIEKMKHAADADHLWYTYWLLVVRDPTPFGAGLIGFKGYPNLSGEVEIGYGIDPRFRGHGYTTEAARALVAWALAQPACTAVVAWVEKPNPASSRILEKVGMTMTRETAKKQFWRIRR